MRAGQQPVYFRQERHGVLVHICRERYRKQRIRLSHPQGTGYRTVGHWRAPPSEVRPWQDGEDLSLGELSWIPGSVDAR